MDKIKKRLITEKLHKYGLSDKAIHELVYSIETITDCGYKSIGGVIGELETWASVYANDNIYKIIQSDNEFIVQPIELKEE